MHSRPRFRALGFDRLEDRRHLSTGLIRISSAVGIKGLEDAGDRIQVQGSTASPTTQPLPRPESWAVAIHDQNATRAQQDQAPVLFLGDSIVYNWGDSGRVGIGSTVWDAQVAPYRAENFGIVGDVTQNVLWQIQGGELAGHPRAVVLLVGTNNLGGLFDSPDETAAGVSAVVEAIRQASPTTKVLVMGIFPRGALPSDPLRTAVSQTNTLMAGLGDGTNVRYMNINFELEQPDGTILRSVMYDFLHLNVDGYQMWANALAAPLQEMLGLAGPPPGTGNHAVGAVRAASAAAGDSSLIVPLLPASAVLPAVPGSAGPDFSAQSHKRVALVAVDPGS